MRHRKSIVAVATACMIAAAVMVGEAHDLFLKPRDFIIRPGEMVHVQVMAGSFTFTDAPTKRARLLDLTVSGPGGITHPERSSWEDSAKDSHWRLTLREPGTHVLGASFVARAFRMNGETFNAYLKGEGIPDLLAERTAGGQLADSAFERFAKHVKAVVRVQPSRGASSIPADTAYRIALGYPAELIPLDDPYALGRGKMVRVLVLVDGRPVPNQFVQAGGQTASGAEIPERDARTDSAGIVRFRMDTTGAWFVKFIHMAKVPPSPQDSVTHESKWATLSFARP